MCVCVCVCVCVCIHMYIHMYTHTFIHVYIHDVHSTYTMYIVYTGHLEDTGVALPSKSVGHERDIAPIRPALPARIVPRPNRNSEIQFSSLISI